MQKLGKEFQEKYKLISVLDEKETYSLYEVEEISTGNSYIVKYYRLNLFWQALGSLRQQMETFAADETEFLSKIYDIGEENNELYVVSEKIEGYNLSDLINRKEKYDVTWVLKLISKIAEGIRYFSKNGVDMYLINPKNIYIILDEFNDRISVKFSEVVSKPYGEEKESDFMMEQAVYMAPEQVGITQKNFDVRSDLYSLGVIAYQLLTGFLPFRAKTLNQYMYLQIAQIPSPVSQHNDAVNQSLNQMVHCLLEKDPDNRYQSVDSLLYDIREYLTGNINFELKSYNSISNIHFREKDFLPAAKMKKLSELIRGEKGLAIISGEKNTGKGIVLDIIKLDVKNQKNITLFGEYDYQAFGFEIILHLLKEYFKIFDNYPLRRQDFLRQEISKQATVSKSLICNRDALFLAFFEDKYQEPVEAEKYSEIENIMNLWKIIGDIEENLVIILKKVCLDEESMELLIRFYSCFQRLLLCVSTGTTGFDTSAFDLSIELTKLSESDILKTLEKITAYRIENPESIANYIYQRSLGNIYLSTEVVNWLFANEALTFRDDRWRGNPLVLFDLGLPAEISQEIIRKENTLSEMERKMLDIMAAIQEQLPWSYIKKIAEMESIDIDLVSESLTQAQFTKFIYTDAKYFTFNDKLIFEHFFKKLSRQEIAYYSEIMGQVIEADYLRYHKAEEAIAMTRYFLRANNNEKIKKYSFETAMFLKNQGKNMEAIQVLNGFLNSLEYQDDDIILFYNAQKMAGEIYIAEGKPEEAEKTFEELLKLELTSEMRADILEERSWVAFYKGNFQEALNFAKAVMKEKKIYIPDSDFSLYLGIAYQILVRFGQSLFGEPKKLAKGNPTRNLREEINQNVWWVSLTVDVRYFAFFSLRTANRFWSRIHKSQELAISYFNLGQLFMGTPFRKMANKYLETAVQITEEIGDDHMKMLSYTILAYQCEVLGDYEGQLNYALMALQVHNKLHFSPFYGMTMNALIHAYNYLGDFSNMLRYNEAYQQRAMAVGDNYGVISGYIYYLQYYRGQANFVNAIDSGEKALKLAEETGDYFDQFCSCAELGVTCYIANKNEEALDYFARAWAINKAHYFPLHYTLILYPYYVMSLCKQQRKLRKAAPNDESLFPLIKEMLKKAAKGKRYPTYYGASLRAMGDWYVLKGNYVKAKKYFRESIDHNIKYKRQWTAAINQYAYGTFLMEIGENSAAVQELILAEYNFRNLKMESLALVAQRELENLQSGSSGMDTEYDKFQRRLQRERNNSFFTDLIRDLSSVLDFKELIQKMIMVLLEASGAQRIAVFLPKENSGELVMEEFYSNENLKVKNKEEIVHELPMTLIKTVLHTKEILVLSNAEKSEYAKMDTNLVDKRIKSVMVLPIWYKNSLKAICYLENSLSTGIFTNAIVDNMKIIASQMAVSMENALLYKNATTDDLTGLYTRKHFDFLFQEELKIAKDSGGHVGVVFIDIDKFKSINDNYGHIIGDKVLIELSKFLKSNCRVTDVIGRFGGEEIILLLRGTSGSESFKFAERLRKKLEKFPINIGEEEINITASFGISSYPEHGESSTELINKADTALYRSKNEGRNRVSIAK